MRQKYKYHYTQQELWHSKERETQLFSYPFAKDLWPHQLLQPKKKQNKNN